VSEYGIPAAPKCPCGRGLLVDISVPQYPLAKNKQVLCDRRCFDCSLFDPNHPPTATLIPRQDFGNNLLITCGRKRTIVDLNPVKPTSHNFAAVLPRGPF